MPRTSPPVDALRSRQVSWLAGRHIAHTFPRRGYASVVFRSDVRRIQLRGQLRNCGRHNHLPNSRLSHRLRIGRTSNTTYSRRHDFIVNLCREISTQISAHFTASLSGCVGYRRGDIVQDRTEPALDVSDFHALARGIVHHLVALDLGDAEIVALGMAEIDPRDR